MESLMLPLEAYTAPAFLCVMSRLRQEHTSYQQFLNQKLPVPVLLDMVPNLCSYIYILYSESYSITSYGY